jgi:putative DNA primase/helicase
VTDLLGAAVRYAVEGWRVLPLWPPDGAGGCTCGNRNCPTPAKHPLGHLVPNGLLDASSDPDVATQRWTQQPNANIGLATGEGLVVLDVDPRHQGDASLAELERTHGRLQTRTARTGGGGWHFYFCLPQAMRTRSGFLPGLDLKAAGGYVVAPPSRHASGHPYTWTDDHLVIEPLPAWLERLVVTPTGQNGNGKRPADPVADHIPEGKRNETLTSLAGSMRRRGMAAAEILAALLVVNRERCDPPLPDAEVERIADSVGGYPAADPVGQEPTEDTPALTDSGNAQRFIARHGPRLHYIAPWGVWLVERNGFWRIDHRDVQVRELAKDVGRSLQAEASQAPDASTARKVFAWALRSLNAHGIGGLVDLARGLDGVPIDHERLDANGWLLGVQNGVIDLAASGLFRAADPGALITLQCPVAYDADATAPRWAQAMEEWFPDPATRAYVQRVAGSALVGVQRDHVFIIHYGGGGNGKGVFTHTLQRVLGPYAVEIHLSLLVESRYKEHDTVRADLFRTRLAVAVETDRHVRLAEASVKNLTGGDRIRARRMREDPWSFDPTHSLWLQTNNLPEIGGRDRGVWRRVRVVKWESTFSGAREDRDLDAKLATELPGILNWLIAGCLDWQRHGLAEPEAVIRETLAYRQKEDVLARFAADTGLVFRSGLEIRAGAIQDLLTRWADEEGLGQRPDGLPDWLLENGASQRRVWVSDTSGRRQVRIWAGVGLDDGNHESAQTDAL